MYRWRERRWQVRRCRECTHRFIDPPPTDDLQKTIYGDEYFSDQGQWSDQVFDGSYWDAESNLREEAREVLDLIPVAGGRLLDVGCAGGLFLEEARQAGFEPHGIELNPDMARAARHRYGLHVEQGFAGTMEISTFPEAFDVVTFLDSLEHIPRLRQTMERIRSWTRQGSILFFRGPVTRSRLPLLVHRLRRLTNRERVYDAAPKDVQQFTSRSLRRLMAEYGFGEVGWRGTSSFANVVFERRTGRAQAEDPASSSGPPSDPDTAGL